MKYLNCFLMLFVFCLDAQASGGCGKAIPPGAVLFQEFNLDSEFACIYELASANDNAILSFYSVDGDVGRLIGSNEKLINLDDARSGVNFPDINKVEQGGYQILWGYPNGVDVITLKLLDGVLYVSAAIKELRPQIFGSNDNVALLTLVNDFSSSPSVELSSITASKVFDKESLRLMGGVVDLKINVDKAFLYSDSMEGAKTKGYLIKGDLVSVSEYKSGYLKVSYKMKNGTYLNRWLSLSSVI